MVSNAPHNPDHEKMKMFNLGYLVGLSGILLVWNVNMIAFLFKSDYLTPGVSKCLGLPTEEDTSTLHRIATVVLVLMAVFSVFIYIRTQQYLKHIQPEHQKNLPAKNALTFLDTYILLLSLTVRFLLARLIFYLHVQDYFSFEVSFTARTILNVCLNDVFLGLVFPLYIILKTRRYLPKLWNDDCQHVQQNNDFYAQSPDESQEDHDIVESRF